VVWDTDTDTDTDTVRDEAVAMASDVSRLVKQDFSDLEAAAKAWRGCSATATDPSRLERRRPGLLPRTSRSDSLRWAEDHVSTMARYADVEIADAPAPRKHFDTCVGKHDEVPEDGRYMLTYTGYAKLPEADHIAAVRKLRTALESHGIRVTGYTERPAEPEAVMYGKSDKEGYSLIADSVNPAGTLRLSVSTPCFLPPGAEQQQRF